jgi:hypothetical protein
MIQKKTRKPSWEYDDLAQKIQVASRRLAAKLVLQFLAKKANDAGESHHGYASIAAHCSIARSQVPSALKYLRDTLKIVAWTKGFGGAKKQDTNRYRLSLVAMRKLIAEQCVFHPETGKLIRVESVQRTGVESAERTGLVIKSSLLKVPDPTQSSLLNVKVESAQQPVTTIEPPNKINPQLSVKDEGLVFSRLSVEEQARQAMRQRRAEMRGAQ